ncbi:hypothetical protein [Flavobacterium sp.]|uniref:hypothetical protein n=1 Tax=Flavobacterium sp. TaxID=239 RepID=UPI003D12BBAC
MKTRIITLATIALCSLNSFAQDKKTVAKIADFLQKREIELVKKTGSSAEYEKSLRGKRKFVLREIDLNGDKKKDYFIFFNEDCGNGGCSALILDSSMKIKADLSLVGLPVVVKAEKNNGWNVLNIESRGMRKLVFNKKTAKYSGRGVANEKFVSNQYKKEKGDQVIIEGNGVYKDLKSFLY